jgi:hypothetical protein
VSRSGARKELTPSSSTSAATGCIATGMHRGEVAELRWSDVNLRPPHLTAPTPGGRHHVVLVSESSTARWPLDRVGGSPRGLGNTAGA